MNTAIHPIEHTTPGEAQDLHNEAMHQAVRSGHWMSAVWCVEDGQLIMVRRTTYDFPRGDFDNALEQLSKVCAEDVAPAEPEALPMADFLKHQHDAAVEEVNLSDESQELMGGLPLPPGSTVTELPDKKIKLPMPSEERDPARPSVDKEHTNELADNEV